MATDPLDRHPSSLTKTRLNATPTDKAVTRRVSRAACAGDAIAGAGLRLGGLGVGKGRPSLAMKMSAMG
jgi:hypothetical protein